MLELFGPKVDVRKLAHAYVALALAQDEAQRYVKQHCAHTDLLPLITSLDITAELLEEILQHVLPEEVSECPPAITSSKLLM